MKDFFFRETGTEFAENGTLVILHGLFGSADNWLTPAKIPAEKYRTILLDQRNHGRSFHADEIDYQLLAEDLADFLDQQEIENPMLLGHSMGGKTVIQFCMDFPGRASKVIVADMGIKKNEVTQLKLIEGMNAMPLSELKTRNDADRFFADYEPSVGVRQFLLKNLYRTEESTFAWRMNLPVLSRNIENIVAPSVNLKPVSVPALFIRGGNSDYVLDEDFDEIRKFFTAAEFSTVLGAGHWLHVDSTDVFMQEVMDFLKK